MKKILQLLLIGILFVTPVLTNVCLSASVNWSTTGGDPPPPPDISPLTAITKITNLAFAGLIVVAVVFIIVSAYFFIVLGGTEDGPKKGRQMLTWALVGVVIALLAKGIVTYLQNFLDS